MLKRILIPLEEYDYSKVAIEYGVNLATGGNCELIGLSILDIPSIEKSIGPVPIGGTYYASKEEKIKKEEEDNIAKKVIHEFETICRSKNIPHKIVQQEGNPEEIIIEYSQYHDLVIMGWKTSFQYGEQKDKRLQHGVISHGICPVIIIPKIYQDIKKILLCYDGKKQSSKAIHKFVQFGIYKNQQFILLNINDDLETGEKLLDKMGEYLNSWKVSYQKVCLKGHPKEVISSYIQENAIDLLVLGAHGNYSITNFFFGSTTQKLIKNADHPLFIYH